MVFQVLTPPTINRSIPRQAELLFALIGIFFHTGSLDFLLKLWGLQRVSTLLRYSIVLLTLLGLLSCWKKTSQVLREARWTWPLVLFSILSVLWSRNIGVTIQSLRSDFIPITLFGIYLGVRFSHSTLFRLLFRSVLILSFISLVVAWLIPSIGRHPMTHFAYPGAWKGIFTHKNSLGFNLILTNVFLFLRWLDHSQKKNLIDYALLFLLIGGTILSESLSALLISYLSINLTWLYCYCYQWRGKPTILALKIVFMVCVSLIGIVSVLWTPLMTGLGKDPTLSARTLIWEYVLGRVDESIILGFGREVFWKTPGLFTNVWRVAHHVPPHAHNGYVDLLADLGYAGLLLFFVALLPILVKVLKLAYQNRNMYDIWPLAFMIIFLISNSVESLLLKGANFSWLIFVVIACSPLTHSGSPPSSQRQTSRIRSSKI